MKTKTPKQQSIRVCGYVRTTTKVRPGHRNSSQRQREAINKEVLRKSASGWKLTKTFSDYTPPDRNGAKLGLAACLQAVPHLANFDVLLVASQDRLSRDLGALSSIIKGFEEMGIAIYEVGGRQVTWRTDRGIEDAAKVAIGNEQVRRRRRR